MLQKEMNKQLSANLEMFNHELAKSGWEVENINEMLNAGISVSPEGMASYKTDNVTIEANLFLSEGELKLFILDRRTDQLVRLVIQFGKDLQEILACLISQQNQLGTKTFPQFLLKASQFTDKIWFVDHEGIRFLLDIPNSPSQLPPSPLPK